MARETVARTVSEPAYRRVDVHPLHRGVVQQITRRIVNGSLKPGEGLPVEPVLAERFGVSRTVIREAMRVLASMGLIQVRQGSGVRVLPSDDWDYLDPLILFEQVRGGGGEQLLDEVLEVRRLLEVEVAGLAAERRRNAELEELRATLEGMSGAVEDPEEFTRLDVMFHECILSYARNRLLRETLKPVSEIIGTGRLITNRDTIRRPGGVEESQRGHEEIYAAIEKGNSQAAREAMRRHVLQFEKDIHAALLSEDGRDTVG